MKMAILLLLCGATLLSAAPRYNGGTFSALSWSLNSPVNKLPWVLDNLNDNTVKEKLDNTFKEYRRSGANMVALMLNPEWDGFQQNFNAEYPFLGDYPGNLAALDARVKKVNAFMALAMKHRIKTVIRLSPPSTKYIHDNLPATPAKPVLDVANRFNDFTVDNMRTKRWIEFWYGHLDRSCMAFFVIANEFEIFTTFPAQQPWTHVRFWGDPMLRQDCQNIHGGICTSEYQGAWVKNVYDWIDANPLFKGARYAFELIPHRALSAPTDPPNSTFEPDWFRQFGDWTEKYTPNVTATGLEFYFDLHPRPVTDAPYYDRIRQAIQAYAQSAAWKIGHKPIWIDEIGSWVCVAPNASCPQTENDQYLFFKGAYRAIWEAPRGTILGQTIWTASNDSPFTGVFAWGMFKDYVSNNPVPRPAWNLADENFPRPYFIPVVTTGTH